MTVRQLLKSSTFLVHKQIHRHNSLTETQWKNEPDDRSPLQKMISADLWRGVVCGDGPFTLSYAHRDCKLCGLSKGEQNQRREAITVHKRPTYHTGHNRYLNRL